MSSIFVENISLRYPVFVKNPDMSGSKEPSETGVSKSTGRLQTVAGKTWLHALKDINFELQSGDRLGIVGLNGSGKSTLLRVVGGIYQPDEGRVSIEGDIAPMFNMGLGVRSESTGRQNIIFRGLLKGLTRREAEARIPEIEAFTELGHFLDMPVRTYSSGMAMRLAFATATAFDPDILLMDEWIGAGDQEFRRKSNERMRDLVSKAGIVVIASHNPALLRDVCNKILWLDKGEVRGFGAREEVFENYVAWCKQTNKGQLK